VRGETARHKMLLLKGLTPEQVENTLTR
jgi:uncharacterized protein YggU (UPF0235/DUF167 family)